MIRAVLFDVDGTLLDTRELILQATERTLSKFGFPAPAREEIAPLVGVTLENFYKIITKKEDVKHFCDSHVDFQVHNLNLVKPFTGVLETLKTIKEKGLKQAAVTSRRKITSVSLLQMNGLAEFFDLIVSEEDTKNNKPHPEPLLFALNKLRVLPVDSLMVGDSNQDILAGKSAGVKTIAVTYGFKGRGIVDSDPDYLIDNIADMLTIVNN